MRRRFIAAHNADFMTVFIHILGNGDAAHYPDLLINVALAAASRTARDTDLIASKLVAGVADRRSNVFALVLYSAEAKEINLLLAIYYVNISVVRFRG